MNIHLVYPEPKTVSEDWVATQYGDAVANCICAPGARTTQQMLDELEDAGIITVGKPGHQQSFYETITGDSDYNDPEDHE